eukprot:3068212-Lingulodinium_polyedra.AAC.1
MAIVISRLRISPEEFCESPREFELDDPRVAADDIEPLTGVFSTPEEVWRFLEHQDAVPQFRNIEHKIMFF